MRSMHAQSTLLRIHVHLVQRMITVKAIDDVNMILLCLCGMCSAVFYVLLTNPIMMAGFSVLLALQVLLVRSCACWYL